MVKPFSVKAYRTFGGRVFKTSLSIRPLSSNIFNFFERTRELIPFKALRSPSNPIGLRVYRTVSISIDHLLKIVLTRDRKSTRLNSSHSQNLVCRLLLEKKKRRRQTRILTAGSSAPYIRMTSGYYA